MAFFKLPLRRSLIFMAIYLVVFIGFISCKDQSPSPGTQPGDSIPRPNPGPPGGRDTLRIKKWATVYITSKEGFDSKDVQDRVDSAKNFYRGLVRTFNEKTRNRIELGFRNLAPIVKDNGENVFAFEVYANYEKACDPCTVPSTRPPYPRVSGTESDFEN